MTFQTSLTSAGTNSALFNLLGKMFFLQHIPPTVQLHSLWNRYFRSVCEIREWLGSGKLCSPVCKSVLPHQSNSLESNPPERSNIQKVPSKPQSIPPPPSQIVPSVTNYKEMPHRPSNVGGKPSMLQLKHQILARIFFHQEHP